MTSNGCHHCVLSKSSKAFADFYGMNYFHCNSSYQHNITECAAGKSYAHLATKTWYELARYCRSLSQWVLVLATASDHFFLWKTIPKTHTQFPGHTSLPIPTPFPHWSYLNPWTLPFPGVCPRALFSLQAVPVDTTIAYTDQLTCTVCWESAITSTKSYPSHSLSLFVYTCNSSPISSSEFPPRVIYSNLPVFTLVSCSSLSSQSGSWPVDCPAEPLLTVHFRTQSLTSLCSCTCTNCLAPLGKQSSCFNRVISRFSQHLQEAVNTFAISLHIHTFLQLSHRTALTHSPFSQFLW